MTIAQIYQNLVAIPSFHYYPVFAQEVQNAFGSFNPTAIALEVSEHWAEEFTWGVSCWPCPMVSIAEHIFAPIVPGDSMVEACRLAQKPGIPIFFIDLALADPIVRERGGPLPDPAFAPRVGNLFFEAVDAIETAAMPADGDLAREAYMARQLSSLIQSHERVLFICGMAHWTRIRDRIKQGNFDAPDLPCPKRPISFRRMRLGASALHRLTQRLPYQIKQFTRTPSRYSDSTCFNKLALAAIKPEIFQAEEIASMLLYARNLAAMNTLGETPDLWDLLTSASSVLGNEYASRLADLALGDRFTKSTKTYPVLTFGVVVGENGHPVLSDGKEILDGECLWPSGKLRQYRQLPTRKNIKRRGANNPAAEVKSAGKDEKTAWVMHPDDERSYVAFIRYVLERASYSDSELTISQPLMSGMADGLDIRATIQNWHKNDIYVRTASRSSVRVTNGLIDWTSKDESSWILQNGGRRPLQGNYYSDAADRGGWIDPSLESAGAVTWEVRKLVEVQRKPFWIQRDFREMTLLTLDTPTWLRGNKTAGRSFYDRVIEKLVALHDLPENNNLYGWLEIMFHFCRGKPFVYYSHYKPSPRIISLGRRFDVSVFHLPLSHIPAQMLQQHQSFRFMCLTRDQWEDLLEKIGEMKQAWTNPEVEARPKL